MLNHLDKLATLVGSISVLVTTLIILWRWSMQMNSKIEQIDSTSGRVDVLERQIIRALNRIEAQQLKAQQNNDRRFDRIEGKLNYLFGKTNITIPPKD